MSTADDELTIDFGKLGSKIKSIISPKTQKKEKDNSKKSKNKHNKKDQEKTDDDLKENIETTDENKKEDYSSKTGDEETEESGSISIDFQSILPHLKVALPFILIAIAILFSTFYRVQPAYLPITDTWAQDTLYNNLRSQIRAGVDAQYPNVPDENKNNIVNIEFNKILEQQKDQIDSQINQMSDYFKSQLQDDTGQTYLVAIDPWTYYRDTKNIIDHGHTGDIIKDGVPYDTHSLAPIGSPSGTNLHVNFQAYLYKFLSIFKRDISVMTVVFFVPVILIGLSIIPAFFIARRKGGNIAGLVAGIIVGISSPLLGRTAAGFSDTDSYNILFPLYVAWTFLEAFETRNVKKMIFLSITSGVLMGIYSYTWVGWWYIFDFLLVVVALSIISIIISEFLKRKDDFKIAHLKESITLRNTVLVFIVFFITTAVLVEIIPQAGGIRHALWGGPFSVVGLKNVGIGTIWPNVYTTVAEQNESSFKQTIQGIGGSLLFALSLIGIILMFFQKDSNGRFDIKYSILLAVWYFGTIYASIKGIRYIILLVPAYGIALGLMYGLTTKFLSKYAEKEFNINKIFMASAVLFVLFLLLLYPRNQFKESWNTARFEVPSMNDAWYNSLTNIRDNSEPDAIITSWWDFGHWFKSIADRPVTFDGGTQNTPMAHWVGRALLTSDEREAIGILRMLDCGSRDGGKLLESYLNNDTLLSIQVMKKIIMVDKDRAKEILLNYINEEKADKVLMLTHCTPPEAFFITSEDMVGKSGVWAHFGSWNFTKATILSNVRNKNFQKGTEFLKRRFNYTDEQAQSMYYEAKSKGVGSDANTWIAPWPSYASGVAGCSAPVDNIITCPNQVIVNLTDHEAYFNTPQGKMYPKSFSYVYKDDVITKTYDESVLVSSGRLLGITLVPLGEDSYGIIFMDYELTGSIFTRTFYLNGHGLKYFRLFDERRSFSGGHILVWKIDWEGVDKLIYYNQSQTEDNVADINYESYTSNPEPAVI